MTIKIAIAGHTNAGKTTLIRSLIRMPVGKIDDAPNVTPKGELHYYEGLQAIFIDTPGFTDPSLTLRYLQGRSMSSEDMNELEYDLEAIKSIRNSDIVIYLVNLSLTYDNSYIKEIKAVKIVHPKIIAVLNQYNSQIKGNSKEIIEGRCRQWSEILNQSGIDKIMIFDGHWDKRSKEEKLYDLIDQSLDPTLRDQFQTGLNKFKKRQKEIRKAAYESLSKVIERLQEIDFKYEKKKFSPKDPDQEKEYKDSISRDIHREIVGFTAHTSCLYEVAADYPQKSTKDVILETKSRLNISGRVSGSAVFSTFLGVAGSVIGGGIGAIVLAVFSNGVATWPGLVEGSKIGSAIGVALGGFLGIFFDDQDIVHIKLRSHDIEGCFKGLIAIIWGLEHQCYGRREHLSPAEVELLKDNITPTFSNILPSDIDWTKINRVDIIKYCELIFATLEKE